jgi:hypothetical protein
MRGAARVRHARAAGRRLRGDRLRPAQGHGLARARPPAVREVVGHRPRRRALVRADPRAQQHQPRPADGDYEQLARLQAGERFRSRSSPRTTTRHARDPRGGRLFPFSEQVGRKVDQGPRAVDAAAADDDGREDPRARKLVDAAIRSTRVCSRAIACLVKVDGGYSHEFTTAQVHDFLISRSTAPNYRVQNPSKFAVFEDHLLLRRRRRSA